MTKQKTQNSALEELKKMLKNDASWMMTQKGQKLTISTCSGCGSTEFYVNGRFLLSNVDYRWTASEDFFTVVYDAIIKKYKLIYDDYDELYETLLSLDYFEGVFDDYDDNY